MACESGNQVAGEQRWKKDFLKLFIEFCILKSLTHANVLSIQYKYIKYFNFNNYIMSLINIVYILHIFLKTRNEKCYRKSHQWTEKPVTESLKSTGRGCCVIKYL